MVWLDFMAYGRLLDRHHRDRLHKRWAVHTDTPNFLARSRNGVWCCRRCRRRLAVSLNVSLRKAGLPSTLPFARAFASPDFTRSPISDLSNWATAPII